MKIIFLATTILVSAANGTHADPDAAYVSAAKESTNKTIAICKHEIAYGKKPEIQAAARKILTIEQENEEYLRNYEATFNITHSP